MNPSFFNNDVAHNTNICNRVYHGSWKDYAKGGQKVEAIKQLRGMTGLGLKESKDIVEHYTVNAVRYDMSYHETSAAVFSFARGGKQVLIRYDARGDLVAEVTENVKFNTMSEALEYTFNLGMLSGAPTAS